MNSRGIGVILQRTVVGPWVGICAAVQLAEHLSRSPPRDARHFGHTETQGVPDSVSEYVSRIISWRIVVSFVALSLGLIFTILSAHLRSSNPLTPRMTSSD